MSSPRVIVGLSGGVDSSVAALLLRDALGSSAVAGLFMQNWGDDMPGECRAADDRRDAVAVAGRLGIPIHFRDFSAAYQADVFRHFLDEYAAGRTPNPDVLCNREVKFKHFLEAARDIGAEAIATGHYARIESHDGRHRLRRALDANKDQSYFLHQLGQDQLAATRFPLGHLPKPEVRRLAAEAGLQNAAKKDSTGICFIGATDFRDFLSHYLPMTPGEIRDPQGRVLGTHGGVYFHTLGQRGGLHLGGLRGRKAEPWYVVGKDVRANVLFVEQGHDNPWLQSRRLVAGPMHWIAGEAPAAGFRCQAQTRYRQVAQPCTVEMLDDGRVHVEFDTAQRAVTPGQSLVLYDGDTCLGGAPIIATDAPLEPPFPP